MFESCEQVHSRIDAKLSLPKTAILALEHMVKFSLLLVYPVLIAQQLQIDVANFISISLLASALIVLLLALPKSLGSNCFVPTQSSVSYFACLLLISQSHNLSLFLGATVFLGALQCVFAILFYRIKKLFNLTLLGCLLFALGVWAAVIGINEFFMPGSVGQIMVHGAFSTGAVKPESALLGLVTIIIILYCWFIPRMRPFSILIGMIIGWIIGSIFHLIPNDKLLLYHQSSWFHVPHFFYPLSFNFSLLQWLALIVVAFYGSLECHSVLAVIDYTASNNNKILDRVRIENGTFTAGVGVMISGFLGGMAQTPIPGSVGDMIFTGIFSRYIAYFYSLFLLVLAFTPKITMLFLTVPAAVNGAAIILMGSTMTICGLRLLNIHHLKPYQLKACAYALLLGILVNTVPEFYHLSIFKWFTNPTLLLNALIFVGLSAIFSIGKSHGKTS